MLVGWWKSTWVYTLIFFLWGLWLLRSQILDDIYRLHSYQYFLQKKEQELKQGIHEITLQLKQLKDPQFVYSMLARELAWVDQHTLVFVFVTDAESKF